MPQQLLIHSKHSCLLVSYWNKTKCFFQLSCQRISSENILTLQGLDAGMHRKMWPQKSDPTKCHLIKTNIIPLASALCFVRTGSWRAEVPPWMLHLCELWNVHWWRRHLHARRALQTLLVSYELKVGKITKESFLIKLVFDSDQRPFFYLFCQLSGHCFSQGPVSTVGSPSPLTKSTHMVALVSFPPRAGRQRGLTVATDVCQERGPLVTVTGWVSEFNTNVQFVFH